MALGGRSGTIGGVPNTSGIPVVRGFNGPEFFTQNTDNAVASITEADDTLAATSAVLVSATASNTEANDTLAATAAATVGASLAVTEASDALTATATVSVSASEAGSESDDTLTASVGVEIHAYLGPVFQPSVFQTNIFQGSSPTDADDTLSATAGNVVAADETGQTILTDRHRRGTGPAYSRKKWKKLLEEEAAERLAEIREVAQIAQVARAATAQAEIKLTAEAAAKADLIQQIEDEDEIILMLLAA